MNDADTAIAPPTEVPASFQSCRELLEALEREDRSYKVFGASKHEYRSFRVSEEDMSKFEDWCGLAMPSDYREYMLHIGHGLGPYYGLWSPAASRSELRELGAGSTRKASPSRPFPYSIADAQKIRSRQAAGEKETWITSTWPIDGCIPICHQGCTYWTVLVVAGECVGRLWDVANDAGDDGLWLPSRRPTGCLLAISKLQPLPQISAPPTFDEWLNGWIERAMAELATNE